MAGVRVGGIGVASVCSPIFPNTDLGVTDSCQIYRACTNNAAGTATQITDFTDGRVNPEDLKNPMLSPDGTKILFETLSSGNDWEIWVVDNVPGSTATQLVAVNDEHYYHPSWAPDSNTFVYVKGTEPRVGGAFTIFKDTVSAIGTPDTLVTQGSTVSGYLARPRFNFDGTRIAYMRNNGSGTKDLRCMDDDGTNNGQVKTISDYDFNDPPSFGWANTQNMIAWQNGGSEVWIGDDTGGSQVQINTAGAAAGIPGSISNYCWPSDDSFVVFAAQTGTIAGSLCVIRAELDGSNTTELSNTNGPPNLTYLKTPIIWQGKIWFFEFGGGTISANYLSYMELDGTGYQNFLDVSAASALEPFGPDWQIYFN